METIYLAYSTMVLIHLLTMLHQFFFYTVTIVPTNYKKIVQTNVGMTIFTTMFVNM